MALSSVAAAQTDDAEDPVLEPSRDAEQAQAPAAARREKPLVTTMGLPPTSSDLGSEADIFGIDDEREMTARLQIYTYSLKGFLRAAGAVGIGPRNDGTPGNELHAPPRVPGLSSGDWNHIGVAPGPSAKVYVSVGNPLATANVILSGNPPFDSGYRNLSEMGWFLEAYLTLKFPTVFGNRGGLAWTVGSFSHRYGTAGPKSTGYYRTYLFGKTHAIGEVLTADIDLTEHVELIVEHGFGAKLEVTPFIAGNPPTLPDAEFIPGQGPVPRGSNFIHHAHVGLNLDYRLKLGAHYMTSWSPNDHTFGPGPWPEARMTISGGDVHLDLDTGNGYIGYSHVDAANILPLSNGIQVLHASQGTDFKKVYLGERPRGASGLEPTNDSGTVDTVLFQYVLKLGNVIGSGPEIDVAAFSMFNHVRSPQLNDPNALDINQNRLKFGGELQAGLLRFMSLGFRFDRVLPDVDDDSNAYSALSPRVVLYSRRGSKEYVIVNYTHFLYGPQVYPGSPYRTLIVDPDPHLLAVSAVMSL